MVVFGRTEPGLEHLQRARERRRGPGWGPGDHQHSHGRQKEKSVSDYCDVAAKGSERLKRDIHNV